MRKVQDLYPAYRDFHRLSIEFCPLFYGLQFSLGKQAAAQKQLIYSPLRSDAFVACLVLK